jgi:Fuc2NAc and GlcNAc transferase
LPVLALVCSAGFTGLTLVYARRFALLDVPNARSSHRQATPRGGGLGIFLAFGTASLGAGILGTLPTELTVALLGGSSMVALVGWMDDHRSLPAWWRVIVHLISAAWVLFWLGGFPSLALGPISLSLGWLGIPLAILALVWLTNLFNFMDGIDGLAGMQAVYGGLAGALLLLATGQQGLALTAFCLAAASAGFLLWNWSPARIFMGDIGSGLLGFVFGFLVLAGERGGLPALVWVIVLGGFVYDATFTLARRVMRGERWYKPHRTHAYQRLVQLGFSHQQVTLGYCLLNLVILWPMAWLAWLSQEWLPWLLGLSTGIGWLLWKLATKEPVMTPETG